MLVDFLIALLGSLAAAGYSLQVAFAPVLIITAALIALVGVVAGVMYAIKKHDRDIDKYIEHIQANIKKLEHQLSTLDWEASRLGDPFHKAAEQSELAYQKFRQASEALSAARQKHKRDADEEQELLEAQTSAYHDMIDLFITMRNEAVGAANDIASALGNAFYDAFAEGTNTARAWGDEVHEIVRNVLRNAIINRYLLPQINQLLDTTFGTGEQGKGFDTSKLTDEGVILQFAQSLEELHHQFAAINAALPDTLQNLLAGTPDSALTSTLEGVTEDTASIMASYLNSIRYSLDAQRGTVSEIATAVTELRNYFPTLQSEIVRISSNTATTAQATHALYDLINRMRTGSASLTVRMV